jgi:aminopeptidase YwaD
MMHRKFFHLALIISLALSVARAQELALTNAPSVERLHAHIEYLASDKLEGRRTGSPGQNLAAAYIAREFSRYGLRRGISRDLPGMSILEADSPNRYLQKFPYVAGVELGKNNLLQVNPGPADDLEDYKVGEDWMPLGFSSNEEIRKAPYVFVGYGITDAGLKYDSYAGHAVKDAVAIALSGTPDGDSPHGLFGRYEDPHWKAIAARNAGAKALFIIAAEETLNEDRLSRLRFDNSAGDAGLPVAVISRQLAARLFGSGDKKDTLQALTKAATAQPANSDPALVKQVMTKSLPVKGVTLSVVVAIVRREVEAANVVGILAGSDPTLQNETIVIGAHYDHLGRGGEGSLAPREGEIHHGADDNASGVAGVLELARMFAAQQPRPRRTLVFIAFSGEEEGLLGSNYYVNHPIVPLANTVAMINMDMIGRMKDNKLIVGGVGTATEWRPSLAAANSAERLKVTARPDSTSEISNANSAGVLREVPIVTGSNGQVVASIVLDRSFELSLSEDGYGPSDHSSFYAKQVPVLFFWTGTHEDYHKPSDTADKINYPDEARIVALVARVVHDVAGNDKRPTYAVAKSESTGRSLGFRVYLGTIPNYADATDGLLLDGVRDDSPAAKAGIKAGDKIVKLADREVKNVYDYTAALGEMKAGQEYEVELMRGGERLKLKITPAAKKP